MEGAGMDVRPGPVRAPSASDFEQPRPIYVVWEITLSCNLKCIHCGSRAGKPRADELSTQECVSVIEQLAGLGTREITLIGGEAYLRRDWLTLIREIAGRGILCGLQTGGRALTAEKIRQAAAAGLTSAGVSIDGLPETHDRLRGVPGSFDMAMRALKGFREHGLTGSVNTQINALNLPQVRDIFRRIVDAGATGWQVQLTVPMGQAADRPELLLQPWQLLELMPVLADLFVEGQQYGFRLLPGNNIGYFGPYEAFWRSITGELEHYHGCNAGQAALGIEADGAIKGCPSLPTRDYVGGNVRDRPLKEIWEDTAELGFTRDPARNRERLWGYCGVCYYADVCQAGCTWTTHVLSGRPGNNPFCHYRAGKLAERGWRERIVPRTPPEGVPFDYGIFDIVVTDEAGREHGQDIFEREKPAVPAEPVRNLDLCSHCSQFVHAGSPRCPHCGGALGEGALPWSEGADVYAEALAMIGRARRDMDALNGLVARMLS